MLLAGVAEVGRGEKRGDLWRADMGVTITIDEKIVEEAKKLTGLADDHAAVQQVLANVLSGRERNKDLADLAGKVRFFDGYDPRALRS